MISALHLPGHHYSVQYGPVPVVAHARRTPDALYSSPASGFLRSSIAGSRIGYAFVDEQGSVLDHVSQRIAAAACPCP